VSYARLGGVRTSGKDRRAGWLPDGGACVVCGAERTKGTCVRTLRHNMVWCRAHQGHMVCAHPQAQDGACVVCGAERTKGTCVRTLRHNMALR